jgi:ElaB/YqjD/DUF883 family membrane-anchored ribosome-binding protein
MDNLYDPGHVCTCGAVIHSGSIPHEHDAHMRNQSELMHEDDDSGSGGALKSKVREIRNRVEPAVRDKVEFARIKANTTALRAQMTARETSRSVKRQSQMAVLQARSFARENPQIVAGVSAGVGLLLGMIVRNVMRRKRHLGVLVIETKSHGDHEAVLPAL